MEDTVRILLLEDLPTDAELGEREVRQVLPRCEFRRVETREEFVSELSSFRPDIILSDFKLPSFDGLAALEIARRSVPDTPFIIVTGSMNEDTAVDCMKAGAWDYVIKEHIRRLGPAVLNALGQMRLRLEQRIADEKSRRWERVFEAAQFGLAHIDSATGTFIEVNDTYARERGYRKEELKGRPFLEIYAPEERAAVERRFRDIIDTGHGVFESVHLRRDGSRFPVLLEITAIADKAGAPSSAITYALDITERRRAQEALAEEAVRRRILIEQSSDGIVVLDQDGGVFEANRRFAEMLRYSPEQISGLHVWDWDERFTRSELLGMIRDIDENGARFESRHRRRDGTYMHMEISTNGAVIGGRKLVFCVCRDVTERKRSEEALRKSEELFRNLFQNHSAVKLLIDPETGGIIDANRAAADYYGWSREQLSGMRIQDINTLQEEDLFREIEEVRTRKRVHLKFRHRRADGSVRDVEVFSSEIETQGRKLLHSIVHDVTERKKAEAALASSEEEFRRLSQHFHALLDAIPDSLMLLDGDLRILWGNRASAESVGMSLEGLTGKRCYACWYGREEPCDPCPVASTFASGRPMNTTMSCDSRQTWDIRTVPLFDATGGVENVIVLKRDITEQARLEAQYLHSQKMESIGTLAGGVAHDFNNILTAILGYGHLALMGLAEDDPRKANIAGMLEAADRAKHLTRELLLFSRKQLFEPKPVDLDDLVTKFERFLKRVIGEDIEVRLDFHAHAGEAGGAGAVAGGEEGRLMILADPFQLEQVLMNLATNARDAMPHGGTLALKTARVELTEDFVAAHGFGKPGDYALLTVTDTGEGMAEETAKRIFEPFFTTKDVGKGTGLGLSVAYGIVKQHDGYINAYSEPGHGTAFRIYLPIRPASATVAAPEPDSEKPEGGTETILVAEDDNSIRELAKTVLSKFGYTVIEASDGEEAVGKFREHSDTVRLLLMDLIMPKMNGKEAYDQIRRIRPDIKIIFSSGYAPDQLMAKVQFNRNSHLIQKPASPFDLLRKVRKVLDEED